MKVKLNSLGWRNSFLGLGNEVVAHLLVLQCASADASVLGGAHDPKQEVSAIWGEEEQPAVKGSKDVRKYCLSSSHFLPF